MLKIKVSKQGLESGADYRTIAIELMNKFTKEWWMNGTSYVSDAYLGYTLSQTKIIYGNNKPATINRDNLLKYMHHEWRKVDISLKDPIMTKVDTVTDKSMTIDFIKRIVAFKAFDERESNLKIATSYAFDYYICMLITDVLDGDDRAGDLDHLTYILEPFLNIGNDKGVSRKFSNLSDERTAAINECFKRAEEDLNDILNYRSSYTIDRHLAAIATYVEQIIITMADLKNFVKDNERKNHLKSARKTVLKCIEKIFTHYRVCLIFESLFDETEEAGDIRTHLQKLLETCHGELDTVQHLHEYWVWYNKRINDMTPEERVVKFGPETAKVVEGIVAANRNIELSKAKEELECQLKSNK